MSVAERGETLETLPIRLRRNLRAVQANPVVGRAAIAAVAIPQEAARKELPGNHDPPLFELKTQREVRPQLEGPATLCRADAHLRFLQVELDEVVPTADSSPRERGLVAIPREREVEGAILGAPRRAGP